MEVPSKSNRNDRRRQLREVNLGVWEGGDGEFEVSANLDTSLKKNTAFIKRCRVGLSEEQLPVLLKEVSTLSLEKYMSEVVADLTEGFTKCKSSADLFAGVEVASALHQRFARTFSAPLLANFLSGINHPSTRDLQGYTQDAIQKETTIRNDRHRIVLRVLIELWMVGVFRYSTDASMAGMALPDYAMRKTPNGSVLPPPLAAIKEVLDYDMDSFCTSSIAIMLLKNYGSVLVGLVKKTDGAPISDSVVPKDLQGKFRILFEAYTQSMQKRVQDLARDIRRLERRNEYLYIKTGKVLDNTKQRYDSMYELAQEMTAACQTLSNYMGLEMPELRLTNETEEEVLIRKGGTVFHPSDSGIWDDDEQRRFYEDLVDLSVLVGSKKDENDEKDEKGKKDENDEKKEEENEEASKDSGDEREDKYDSDDDEKEDTEDSNLMKELDQIVENGQLGSEAGDTEDTDNEDDSEFENEVNQPEESAGQQMQALLLKLSSQTSREVIDEVAEQFLQLNNKASRNRIIKFMTSIPLDDEFKLPFYSRFIATLNPVCPEITSGVVDYLDQFFKYLQRKRKVKALYQRRIFNTRYLSELTKFGLVEKHIIFNKLKMTIERLDADNVQTIANLLEGCGRYLLRNTQTNVLMTKMLQVLDKQKTAKYMSVDHRAVIDGALAYVRPDPDAEAYVQRKERSVIEKYIRHLVYVELNGYNIKSVLTLLRRLDWNDDETFKALAKVFFKIHKVKTANVSTMASYLKTFTKFYPQFVVMVVDATLEGIKRGLELATFSMNQMRIAQVKYAAEMCALGLISRELMFENLYSFITFGHPGGTPNPATPVELDPPEDFFRIRLICTALENAEMVKVLDDGKHGKFELFLAFFQYYMFTKTSLSMDVQFQIHDVFDMIRPHMKRASSGQIASKVLGKAIARANGQPVEHSDEEEEPIYENNDEKEDEDEGESEEQRLEREEKERIKNLEAKRVHAQKEDLKARAEFERDFKKLMVDRLDNGGSKPTAQNLGAFDEPVPSKSVLQQSAGAHEVVDMTRKDGSYQAKTSFSLLTKKGNKPQATAVAIPAESKFAQSVAKEQQRLKEEHDDIKRRILKYSNQHEYEDDESDLPKISQPQISSSKYVRNKRPPPNITNSGPSGNGNSA